jgi:hypothetical protein
MARVVPSLRALNMKGSALGSRSQRYCCTSLAAYERIRSSESGFTSVRPRKVFTTIGKNTVMATITALEGQSIPIILTSTGARATMGTLLKMAA